MPCGSFYKDAAEHYPVGINMAGNLPTGRTLSRATVSATNLADGTDATATVLVRTAASLSGSIVDVPVKAGAASARYKILFNIYDDANNLYRESIVMCIKPV